MSCSGGEKNLTKKDANMINQILLAAAFTFLALGAVAQSAPQLARAACAQANSATLDEVLKRLEKTLTRHGSRAMGGVISRFDAKDFRGCRITYELTPQVAPDHKGFVPFIERVTVDLSSLDSTRVEVRNRDNESTLSFATREGEPRVETRLASEPHLFNGGRRFRSHYIFLTNKAAAEEAREALVRAIDLCKR